MQAEDTAKKKTEFFTDSVEAPPTLSKVGVSRATLTKQLIVFISEAQATFMVAAVKVVQAEDTARKKTASYLSIRKFRMYIRKFRMYVRGHRMYILSLRTKPRTVRRVWVTPLGSGPIAPGRNILASV